MASAKDRRMKRFIIPETMRHEKGFTIYKVTSMVVLNSPHEEISKISVWKRYNDFKKLHSELNNLHKQLKIKENFPALPKSKYFGRFEADVIEQRRQYALKLLEFVGRYSYLYSSDIFIRFFETSHMDDYTSDCAYSLSSDTSEDDRTVNLNNYVLTNDMTQNTSKTRCLSNASYNISTDSCTALSSTIYTKANEFTVSQTNKSHDIISLTNAAVKESEETCKMTKLPEQITIIKDYDTYIENKNLNESNVTYNKSRFDNLNNNINKDISKVNITYSTCSVMLREKANFSQIRSDYAQYILIAAGHISSAFKHESITEYEEAFVQYKLGIACLVTGIQLDPDGTRVASIKDKISKYLARAEQLYNRHLNCNISLLIKPASELQYYKVLKIMKSVMLAVDKRVNSKKIIKTIEKFPIHEDNINNYILHGRVPYMVHLCACIETESTIFLILQYASSGELWDFIRLHYNVSGNLHDNTISSHTCVHNQIDKKLNSNENIHEPNKENEVIEYDKTWEMDYPCFLDEQSKICNMEMPTTQLLEKSQKLLESVDATLKKSNFIASRLNKFRDSKQWKNTSLSTKPIGRISQNSDHSLSDIYYNKSSFNSIDVDAVTTGRIITKSSIENKDLRNSNSLSTNNLRVAEDTCASVFNKNRCAASNTLENKTNYSLCGDSISEFTLIQTISTNTSDKINTLDAENSSLILDKFYNIYETQYILNNTIKTFWQVPETVIRLWGAEILLALEALHQQGVLIFYLKPDNILLDNMEHIQLTYIIPQRDIELSKLTYPYSSPELATFSPTTLITSATDIWSFGVILYELLTGIAFAAKHPGLFHSHSLLRIPRKLSENARSLLHGMLKYHSDERLTIDEIKHHPFFAEIDWSKMINY